MSATPDTSGKVKVRLVADRPSHKDLIYGTNIEWDVQGAVRDVSYAAWQGMKKHPDVYELVEDDETEKAKAKEAAKAAKDKAKADADPTDTPPNTTALTYSVKVNGEPIQIVAVNAAMLDANSDEDVRKEAERRGYALNARLSSPNLRIRFLEAQNEQIAAGAEMVSAEKLVTPAGGTPG